MERLGKMTQKIFSVLDDPNGEGEEFAQGPTTNKYAKTKTTQNWGAATRSASNTI